MLGYQHDTGRHITARLGIYLLIGCAVSTEKYYDRSSDVQTEWIEVRTKSQGPNNFQHWPCNRLIRTLSYDINVKRKMCPLK